MGESPRVQLFASARELVGAAEVELAWEAGGDVAGLRAALAGAHPELAGLLERSMVAVNQEYATPETPVSPGDEVAVIPPVSGGATGPPSEVTEAPIDAAALEARVASPGAGAVTTFLGVVRDNNVGRNVLFLEYEGYGPMASKVMDEIARETEQRWSGCLVAMAHRVGRLEIGEASVAIAVSSPHRAEAFEACRHAIDDLKRRVPIWKKEHFEGGEVWIETQEDRQPVP